MLLHTYIARGAYKHIPGSF